MNDNWNLDIIESIENIQRINREYKRVSSELNKSQGDLVMLWRIKELEDKQQLTKDESKELSKLGSLYFN